MDKAADDSTQDASTESKESFLQLDTNSDGTIRRVELASSLCKEFKDCTKEDAGTYMTVADVDKDGKINFTLTAWFKCNQQRRQELKQSIKEFKEMVSVLKTNGGGCVTLEELQQVLKNVLQPKNNFSYIESNYEPKQTDSNRDDKIDKNKKYKFMVKLINN